MDLQAINEVKVTYQGQGHTSRARLNQGQHQIEVIFKERYSYAGGLHLNQMRSCLLCECQVLKKTFLFISSKFKSARLKSFPNRIVFGGWGGRGGTASFCHVTLQSESHEMSSLVTYVLWHMTSTLIHKEVCKGISNLQNTYTYIFLESLSQPYKHDVRFFLHLFFQN